MRSTPIFIGVSCCACDGTTTATATSNAAPRVANDRKTRSPVDSRVRFKNTRKPARKEIAAARTSPCVQWTFGDCYSYSITMLIVIDPNGATPLYAQIASQLRRAIAEGKVKVGERLPAARELAESLAVNLHAVLRAYDALRAEGVLDVRRGRGVVVVGAGGDRARLVDLARAFATEGARQGF